MNLIRTFFIGAFFFLNALPLTAQSAVCSTHSCCNGGHDATPASVMISHVHNKNEAMVSYRYMTMGMSGIASGTQTVDKTDVFNNYIMASDNMRMDMHMLMGMYGVTDRLTVMAMLNYNINMMNMDMFTTSGHHHGGMTAGNSAIGHHMHTMGFGDVKVSALYGLVKLPNHQLVVGAGVSLPTGNIKIKGATDDAMYPNRNYPYMMQLGSGTFDILPCVSYLFQKNKMTGSVQASSVVRMGRNTEGYQLGNEATVNAWLAYQWLSFLSSSVRLEGTVADKISGNDPTLYAFNELSANTSNYGGQRVNCAIGSVFQVKNGFFKNNRLGVECSLPVYQNLNGTQMKSNNTLTASWSMAF